VVKLRCLSSEYSKWLTNSKISFTVFLYIYVKTMNVDTALELQKKLKISMEQIVREEYEMIILRRLYESDLGKYFVFKGGTALRLAYGSPRFSEDLDFSTLKKVNEKELYALMAEIANDFDNLELVEGVTKRFTYFGLFKVSEGYLKQNFRIKFEASRRLYKLEKDKDYHFVNIESEVTSLTALVKVITIEEAFREKKAIDPKRVRDMFDLWFIGRKLRKDVPLDFSGFSKQEVQQELNKFLPLPQRRLLEQFI
jgi:predicted nucleotidyltransferase component of viral defense system